MARPQLWRALHVYFRVDNLKNSQGVPSEHFRLAHVCGPQLRCPGAGLPRTSRLRRLYQGAGRTPRCLALCQIRAVPITLPSRHALQQT